MLREAVFPENALLRKFSDQTSTLAHAVGLVVMRQQGSRVCWATDHHLGLAVSCW